MRHMSLECIFLYLVELDILIKKILPYLTCMHGEFEKFRRAITSRLDGQYLAFLTKKKPARSWKYLLSNF